MGCEQKKGGADLTALTFYFTEEAAEERRVFIKMIAKRAFPSAASAESSLL
jgi:hypothetical protein